MGKIIMEHLDYFVDSHHGIYSGQIFAQYLDDLYKAGKISGITSDDWVSLLNGPDDEYYLDAWAEIDNLEITDNDGKVFNVYQNEGIWLYPKEMHDKIDWESFN